MKIVLLEPYFSGSHKSWALGLQSYSKHQIKIISLPVKFWKWRMRGGAITLANDFMKIRAHATSNYHFFDTNDYSYNLPKFNSLNISS